MAGSRMWCIHMCLWWKPSGDRIGQQGQRLGPSGGCFFFLFFWGGVGGGGIVSVNYNSVSVSAFTEFHNSSWDLQSDSSL